MPTGTQQDDESMFAGGERVATQRLLDETRQMLENTGAFLRQISSGDEHARRYLEGLKNTLENDLRRLKKKSPGDGEPPPEPEK